ncbi:hypothetical protein MP228_002778 [Amoeboaphelidium protococcarum]|nr:hypothetical protein MP228_002778 [Amoeboaphelidium protococcarum]
MAKVSIIGGGTAGITVASQLVKRVPKVNVTIVEPSEMHHYQPIWTLVGGGVSKLDRMAQRSTADVIKSIGGNVKWIQSEAVEVEAQDQRVILKDSSQLKYDNLVLATGFQYDFDAIAGLRDGLFARTSQGDYKYPVCSNYVDNGKGALKTFDLIKKARKDVQAVFTQPATPIKCAGAPQKIMYLADDYWTRHSLQHSCKFISGMGKIFSVDKYAQSLETICKSRGLDVMLNLDLVGIDLDSCTALFKPLQNSNTDQMSTDQNGNVKIKYDMLHVTPKMKTSAFIKASGLANESGAVDVREETLQHLTYPNIFSLGDCAGLSVSKTMSAITAQSAVVVDNLISQLQGKEAISKYDGYTSCPLVTGQDKLILAEFNGFPSKGDVKPHETFWFNQAEEHKFPYLLKKHLMPELYWNLMLKGMWTGPSTIRHMLNPLKRD